MLPPLIAILLLINGSIIKFYSFLSFCFQVYAVILLLSCFETLYIHFLFFLDNSPAALHNLRCSEMLLHFFTSSMLVSHGVQHYFPRLGGMGISDAIFNFIIFLSIM